MKFYFIFFGLLLMLACKKKNAENVKPEWIENAFSSLSQNKYPKVKAISWWHENFEKTYLRIDSSPKSLEAYKKGVDSEVFITSANLSSNKLIAPVTGIYHAAFPDFGGTEDIVTTERISAFENLAAKNIVWAYFSDNWLDAIEFPLASVNTIRAMGKIPFIRMMPRSNFDQGSADPIYTMQGILNGDLDTELTQWAIDAAAVDGPLLVEFGTEVNGNWFSWNGQYNGKDEKTGYGDPSLADGPERFRDAYRHIVDICNANGAVNITWFFHVDANSEPNEEWNNFENYYPGDDYVDWIGVSIYGPQNKKAYFETFSEIMDETYSRLVNIADKPIAVLEFGITEF